MNNFGQNSDEETKIRRIGRNKKGEGIRSPEKQGTSIVLIKPNLNLLQTNFCTFQQKNLNFTKIVKVIEAFDEKIDLCIFY